MYRTDIVKHTNGFGVQGDVPIVRRQPPEGLKPIAGKTLRLGEATGHHHVVDGECQLYEAPTGELWMQLFSNCKIQHQEHGVLVFEPGWYVVGDQIEYDGEEERRVLD